MIQYMIADTLHNSVLIPRSQCNPVTFVSRAIETWLGSASGKQRRAQVALMLWPPVAAETYTFTFLIFDHRVGYLPI